MILIMLKCKGKLTTLRLFLCTAIIINLNSPYKIYGNQPSISHSEKSFILPEINFEDKVHQYYSAIPDDSFSRLSMALKEKNGDHLQFRNEKESLESLLNDLNISKHSQVLVFSNTSLQLSKINSRNPRAIYFNDDLYVGYVAGGFVEIIGVDPEIGAIPFMFKLPQEGNSQYPPIRRSSRCMRCHASEQTGQVPGLLLSSVIPAETGGSLDNLNPRRPGHQLAYNKRFGGWFITDQNLQYDSWANSIGKMENGGEIRKEKISIPKEIIRYRFLTPKSELATHLVLEHQIGFTNLCLSIQYGIRETSAHPKRYNNQAIRKHYIEELIKYSLFREEPQLLESQLSKPTNFRRYFETMNIATSEFRRLNLKTRLFETRCSYMLWSRVFNKLPKTFKSTFIDCLENSLLDKDSEYAHLTDHLSLRENQVILRNINSIKKEAF